MATYFGVDVSQFQGTINWTNLAAAKDFAIIKASGGDGGGFYTDSKLATNQTNARSSGIKIGYYHFGSNYLNPVAEADYFVAAVGSLQQGEVVVLDAETAIDGNGFSHFPTDSWCFSFLAELKAQIGFNPVIYMNYSTAAGGGGLNWPTVPTIARLWVAYWGVNSSNFSIGLGAWGNYSPNYQWLQYSDSGSASGISGAVDLDSFFSPNGTLNDWYLFGKPGTSSGGGGTNQPGTGFGVLTSATVTDPIMTYTQPAKQTIVVPVEKYDQVVFSTTYRPPTITSSTWPVNITGPDTGMNQYAYPVGNYGFSISGGASGLIDYGSINAGDFGQFPGNLPPVTVQPIVSANGALSFDVTVNGYAGSVSLDLELNIALLAWPNSGDINPNNPVSQGIAYSNVQLNSPNNYSTYRRVFSEGSVGQGAITVAHDQSTIPSFLYWVQDNTSDLEPQPVAWKASGHATSFGISMDATNIYFYVNAANNTACWYRIYKDN